MGKKLTTLFHHIGDEIKTFFKKLFDGGAEEVTQHIIDGLNVAKIWSESQQITAIAAMFPNGIGKMALNTVQHFLAEAIPTLEIALNAEHVIAGISDPVEKAEALMKFVINNINNLPASMRGKHWEDIAVRIMKELLALSTTEAKLLLHYKLGQMKAGN